MSSPGETEDVRYNQQQTANDDQASQDVGDDEQQRVLLEKREQHGESESVRSDLRSKIVKSKESDSTWKREQEEENLCTGQRTPCAHRYRQCDNALNNEPEHLEQWTPSEICIERTSDASEIVVRRSLSVLVACRRRIS